MLVDFDIKTKLKEMLRAGKKLPDEYFDLGIAMWLLDPDKMTYLRDSSVYPPQAAPKATRDALRMTPEKLYEFLFVKLKENNLEKVFYKIETPLLKVLAEMETRGILIDIEILEKLRKELDRGLEKLVKDIYKKAGREFNINSPKQLGEILFDVLGIKPRAKTKTGGRSTSAESLEAMKEDHALVPLILDYRELFKLQSTYVAPLLENVKNSNDARIHTTFLQTGTATGRLSSENPNLQNIPAIGHYAKHLRGAFVAPPKHSFLSLDYSQIELRVLASVSSDPKMIEAFLKDQDIHKITASNVFNVAVEDVTPEMRYAAKTLNFGVIYGMGPQAFARATGKSYEEAIQFIDEYFYDFAEVRIWQDRLIEKAKQTGYVENLNGRKRWLPNIASYSPRLAAEARRAAINMPIQGLAADIIKLAMIAVCKELPNIKLLLSIHDELVFEVPDVMLKETAQKVKKIMEGVYRLQVPLKVEMATGKNWAEIS
jgi:DNA polymerase-1